MSEVAFHSLLLAGIYGLIYLFFAPWPSPEHYYDNPKMDSSEKAYCWFLAALGICGMCCMLFMDEGWRFLVCLFTVMLFLAPRK